MRAPPEAVKTITGSFFSAPTSMARMIFSPTTEPMLPPMNRKSMTARTTSCAVDLAQARDHGLLDAGLLRRGAKLLLVVGELQRVGRLDVRGQLLEHPFVGGEADPLPRGEAEVVLAVGTGVERGLQLMGRQSGGGRRDRSSFRRGTSARRASSATGCSMRSADPALDPLGIVFTGRPP